MSPELNASAAATAITGVVPGWSEACRSSSAPSVWTWGSSLSIARSFAAGARAFIVRLALEPGESVLDVGCGAGNRAILAARAGARVCGIDSAPNLIAHAQVEARAAGCNIAFAVGDSEVLPYGDGQFDTTVTMFGTIFSGEPERAATELLRVTRSRGRLAMANWTSDGFVGQMLRACTALTPLSPGVPNPLEWGEEEVVRDRFRGGLTSLICTRRSLQLRFPFSPVAVADLFATAFGPTVATLRATDADGARQLRSELTRLFQHHNLATNGTTTVVGEYLDVQARVA